ncbi:MAG TPA: hypothetical protein VJ201_01590, partial [Candidatus Babeliales bacterium]|nr:hypothetical protein [Candidatus Babeliales bacterium]
QEQKIRRITAAYAMQSEPLAEIIPPSLKKSKDVSFEKTHPSSLSIHDSRPSLNVENNGVSIGYQVAKAISENEAIISDIINMTLKNINTENENILKLNEEEKARLQKHIEDLSKKYGIDMVKSILNCAASATSIVIGTTLAPNLFIGYIVIASAAMSISNELAPRFGLFEKAVSLFTSEKDKIDNYSSYLQSISTLSTLAFSLASSLAAYPQLATSLIGNTLVGITDSALKLSTGISNYVSSMTEKELKLIEAEQTELISKLKIHTFEHKKHSGDLSKYAEMYKGYSDTVRDIVLLTIKINRKVSSN